MYHYRHGRALVLEILSCLLCFALEKGGSGTGVCWKKHVGKLSRREQIFFKMLTSSHMAMLRWVVLMRALSPIYLLPWCKKCNSDEGVSLYPQSHWAQPQEALIVVCYSLILLSSWWRFLAKKTRLQMSHSTAIPGQKYSPKQVWSERVRLHLLLLLEQNRTCLRRQAARTCLLGCFGAVETWPSKMVQLSFFVDLFSVTLENILQLCKSKGEHLP